MKRRIVEIDEGRCNGCGDCIPGCPEGALQVIDGKARLVSDLFCDGLGACIGACPQGAMTVREREAEPYDERRVMEESIIRGGRSVIAAHLRHLTEHGEQGYLREALAVLEEKGIENPLDETKRKNRAKQGETHGGCPGSAAMRFGGQNDAIRQEAASAKSELTHWPVQLHLVTPLAPCYHGADLLLAADCAAFAMGGFHSAYMKGKSIAIACPKLDSGIDRYVAKLTAMIDMAKVNTITVAIMEVPCCGGLMTIVRQAQEKASRKVPVKKVVIGVRGEVLDEEWI
ncbi:4Fe-4S ferredoxin [Prosthecochloris sp. GSB1]|uniref:ATP-binding protein n=1 Tax=Prosthecochloris sp. GSB1 TaxID=281093 RepID=UPI000B8C77DD|nr:4Fe-4S dicluster domain-containing protein [Prosthecochloris sp. GSB1]ASQ91095.1 4Fe-4S ferredoxin [Prosthecochloris sp. GSB1]